MAKDVTWRIRPIDATDDVAIGAIVRQTLAEFACVGPGFASSDAELDYMSRAYPGGDASYWVLERVDGDGHARVVGGAGFGPLAGSDPRDGICELRKMYLLAEGRGFGNGSKLIDLCIEAARRVGYRTMYLETRHNMTAARKLYERRGFASICSPRGETGHGACDTFYQRTL